MSMIGTLCPSSLCHALRLDSFSDFLCQSILANNNDDPFSSFRIAVRVDVSKFLQTMGRTFQGQISSLKVRVTGLRQISWLGRDIDRWTRELSLLQ